MGKRSRAEGWQHAKLSGHRNEDLIANKALTLHAMNNYVAAIELYKELLTKHPNERIEQNLNDIL